MPMSLSIPTIPKPSRAQIELDLNSIDLGSADADTEVKRKPWLDVVAFPKAKFISTSIKALPGGGYQMAGKLTLKGTTREVFAPFALKQDASGVTTADGVFEIKRLDFKSG